MAGIGQRTTGIPASPVAAGVPQPALARAITTARTARPVNAVTITVAAMTVIATPRPATVDFALTTPRKRARATPAVMTIAAFRSSSARITIVSHAPQTATAIQIRAIWSVSVRTIDQNIATRPATAQLPIIPVTIITKIDAQSAMPNVSCSVCPVALAMGRVATPVPMIAINPAHPTPPVMLRPVTRARAVPITVARMTLMAVIVAIL